MNPDSSSDRLALIGAGFGRTGTTSLQKALELLGSGPCYHMRAAMIRPGHARFWIRARTGPSVDFSQLFRGYRATVDWPACEFYRELMAVFPDAKVLLNVRDPAAWYESTRETLFAVQHALPWWFPPSILRMQDVVIWRGRFNGQFLDRESAIAAFNAHNDRKHFRRVLLGLRIASWAVPTVVLAVLAGSFAYLR